ncbi:NAD(P)H-dependent oxidoreductase [Methylococcus sp. Mc7]|uniref:NAD(P)H-dependent oxidoreductase n=1 Tax=Methylococcus sp. Mc7 TaxID=2860258 RepID=UPI001C52E199|nr:NAD(P)H-dependent oxidoreductase [Methylococcus sp. Mc7]QXP84470.1 NAD(P)H-dependent oxidoreductase [Methylococcus sp. Mc7]
MSTLKTVVVSGNLGSPSKTLTLAGQIVDAIRPHAATETETLQLAELAPVVGPARNPNELGSVGKAALNAITAADILIAVTPVYKGAYTGLFKHLFDLLDPKALNEKPVILGATGGGDKHALIVEHQLRPLFGFFGAFAVPSGVYAAEQLFDGQRFADPVVLERIEAAARQAVGIALNQTLPATRAA